MKIIKTIKMFFKSLDIKNQRIDTLEDTVKILLDTNIILAKRLSEMNNLMVGCEVETINESKKAEINNDDILIERLETALRRYSSKSDQEVL